MEFIKIKIGSIHGLYKYLDNFLENTKNVQTHRVFEDRKKFQCNLLTSIDRFVVASTNKLYRITTFIKKIIPQITQIDALRMFLNHDINFQ